jgi:glycosyltransferase involved in cell wall biosynthesis
MLTIGLPVFNGEPFVTEAIDSLLAQTHRDFLLVIADNC